MMIQAVLGNPHHPEYGVATIPFPIPRDQYAHCMELLEALEIGDAVKADCKVEKIDSFYGGQFKEILDEQTFLKEKRSGILADNNEQAKANQRIMDAAQTLENASPHITEWDESAVRQLVETVKVLSKDEIAVTLKGGIEICQKIMY